MSLKEHELLPVILLSEGITLEIRKVKQFMLL
jgi:hypothetical protein